MKNNIIALFKNIDFLILFWGQLISKMGSSINTIGMSLYVLKFENPVFGMGTLSLLLVIPWILVGPYAGLLADRYSKRTIIVFCDIIRGFLSICLFFIDSIWIFFVIVFAITILDVLFTPAINGYIPFIVPEENIEVANSWYSGSGELARLLGPAIGGFLVANFGSSLVFFINGISLIISGISEIFIKNPGIVHFEDKEKTPFIEDLKVGLQYAKTNNNIKFIIVFFAIASSAFGGFSILYATVATQNLGLSDEWYGIFATINGVGSLLGAMALPYVLKKVKELPLMIIATGIYALLYLIFALTNYIPLNLIIFMSLGIFISFVDVTYGIYLQKSVDKEYIGRVFSLDMSLSNFTMIFSILFVTFYGNQIGPKFLMIISSLCLIIICFFGYIFQLKLNDN